MSPAVTAEQEPRLAAPPALLLAGNVATTVGSTAVYLGGPGGLAVAAMTGAAAAATSYAVRAHQKEAEHRGAKPARPVVAKRTTPTAHAAQRAARVAANRSRRVTSTRAGRGATRTRSASPTGRGAGGAGRPKRGLRLPTGLGSRGQKPGMRRSSAAKGVLSGAKSPAAAPHGRGRTRVGKLAGSRPMSLLGAAGRAARAAVGRASKGRSIGHGTSAGRSGAGVSAGRGRTGRAARTARGAHRTVQGAVGRATHRVAGSKPVRAASKLGRATAKRVKARRARQKAVRTAVKTATGQGAGPRAAAKAARNAYGRTAEKQANARGKRRWWSPARITGRIGRRVRLAGVTARVAAQVAIARAVGRVKQAIVSRAHRAGKRLGDWIINTLGEHQQLMKSRGGWLLLAAALTAWPVARVLTGHPIRQTVTPTDVHPDVADTTDDPGHTTDSTQKGNAMPNPVLGQALLARAQEMKGLAATYEPDAMLTWGADMQLWAQALQEIAEVAAALARGADKLPIHPAVRAATSAVVAVQVAAAKAQDQVVDNFEKIHKVQLDNVRNPAPGAEKWDVRVNRQ